MLVTNPHSNCQHENAIRQDLHGFRGVFTMLKASWRKWFCVFQTAFMWLLKARWMVVIDFDLRNSFSMVENTPQHEWTQRAGSFWCPKVLLKHWSVGCWKTRNAQERNGTESEVIDAHYGRRRWTHGQKLALIRAVCVCVQTLILRTVAATKTGQAPAESYVKRMNCWGRIQPAMGSVMGHVSLQVAQCNRKWVS